MARMPIQAGGRGVASEAAAGRGSGSAVDGNLSAAAGLRRASAIPARPLRRNALARVIVDLRGSTKGPAAGMKGDTIAHPRGAVSSKKEGGSPQLKRRAEVTPQRASGFRVPEVHWRSGRA